MTDELLKCLQQYARGEAALEATAQRFAAAYRADGTALYLDAGAQTPAVRARLEELWARYSALVVPLRGD